jgi:hypothetical protein
LKRGGRSAAEPQPKPKPQGFLATKNAKTLGYAGEYFPRAYRRLASFTSRRVLVFFVAIRFFVAWEGFALL